MLVQGAWLSPWCCRSASELVPPMLALRVNGTVDSGYFEGLRGLRAATGEVELEGTRQVGDRLKAGIPVSCARDVHPEDDRGVRDALQ